MNRFTIYFPSVLALVVIGGIMLVGGERQCGRGAAAWAGLAMVFSLVTIGESLSTRYDLFFTVPVTLGAWATFRAWETGRGWTWFWLAAAVATLTKGPLGLLLPGCGLLAVVWERRSGQPVPLRGSHWAGLVLYFTVSLGWLALAYRQEGERLLQTLFVQELFQHSMGSESETAGGGLYIPTVVLLFLFAPWGWLALCGVWRAWKTPAADATERRWERFLTCWLVTGLVLFSAAAHGRSRLMLPVLPAAAWLAGREVARWLAVRRIPAGRAFGGAIAAGLAVAAVMSFVFPGRSRHVAQSRAYRDLGTMMRRTVGTEFPLTYQQSTTTAVRLKFYEC